MGERTILVVDDSELVRTLLGNLLTGWGYAVVMTDDPELALKVVDEQRIDAVLTDLHLAGEIGTNLCRRLSQRADHGTRPVWLMSGSEVRDLTDDALMSGAIGFLRKPFKPAELREKLESVWGGSPAAPVPA
jgi:CheY-like chemotaxis protein